MASGKCCKCNKKKSSSIYSAILCIPYMRFMGKKSVHVQLFTPTPTPNPPEYKNTLKLEPNVKKDRSLELSLLSLLIKKELS